MLIDTNQSTCYSTLFLGHEITVITEKTSEKKHKIVCFGSYNDINSGGFSIFILVANLATCVTAVDLFVLATNWVFGLVGRMPGSPAVQAGQLSKPPGLDRVRAPPCLRVDTSLYTHACVVRPSERALFKEAYWPQSVSQSLALELFIPWTYLRLLSWTTTGMWSPTQVNPTQFLLLIYQSLKNQAAVTSGWLSLPPQNYHHLLNQAITPQLAEHRSKSTQYRQCS